MASSGICRLLLVLQIHLLEVVHWARLHPQARLSWEHNRRDLGRPRPPFSPLLSKLPLSIRSYLGQRATKDRTPCSSHKSYSRREGHVTFTEKWRSWVPAAPASLLTKLNFQRHCKANRQSEPCCLSQTIIKKNLFHLKR